jgi:hypothetical protein
MVFIPHFTVDENAPTFADLAPVTSSVTSAAVPANGTI